MVYVGYQFVSCGSRKSWLKLGSAEPMWPGVFGRFVDILRWALAVIVARWEIPEPNGSFYEYGRIVDCYRWEMWKMAKFDWGYVAEFTQNAR